MSEVSIKQIDDFDIVQYQPKGVCSRMMQVRIKEDIIHDVEFVGGCAGNLSGIGMLVKGMNINEVKTKLEGIPCGSRPTSCPDQLSKALAAYITEKEAVKN